MKIAIRITQILVGVLFILSGLVKANDPQGLGFKMQEFFEIWSADLARGGFFAKGALTALFQLLHEHTLGLSVTMITLEILAGVALLGAWKKRLLLWLLLVLILFFTFLTGYAFLSVNPDGSAKFTNCGCFGDCLPLQPKTSFLKDLALLALTIFLIIGQRFIQPLIPKKGTRILLPVSLIVVLVFQWYVLHYLPIADCLPFKVGNNISAKMKAPPNAVPSVYDTRVVYKNLRSNEKREMSQADFNQSKIWENPDWKWDTTITRLLKKGNDIPEIQGFSLSGTSGVDSISGAPISGDSTNFVLTRPVAVLGFGMEGAGTDWLDDFAKLVGTAKAMQIPVYFTSNNKDYFVQHFNERRLTVPVFSTDFTIIRTAARTNPAFYLLENGTITGKYSYRSLGKLTAKIAKR